MRTKRLTCQHPDRDCPKLKCGYPMPCPHHTVTLSQEGITIPPHRTLTGKQQQRLKELGEAVK